MIKALFLDRDGVINTDFGYTHEWEPNIMIAGIIELIKKYNGKGYCVCIITNQSGIGRGYYSEIAFHRFMEHMITYCKSYGAIIDKFYYCKCIPSKRNCENRKPNPGMLFQASKDLGINLEASIFVGDKITDMEAAERASIGRKFLYSPNGINTKNYNSNINYKSIRSFSEIK